MTRPARASRYTHPKGPFMSWRTLLFASVVCAVAALAVKRYAGPVTPAIVPPAPPREFRAAWVATVDNIDWPSKRGLPVSQQKAEALAILDKAADLNLNAIVLQVRPACDALYNSKIEPWSEYLTAQMGKAPRPYYDPLEFWIREAHKRGLELHAWFNPYRAHHPSARSEISSGHVSKAKPSIVRTYGKHLWMDPGEKGTQDHSLAVIMDVAKRYDVDGVHMDDYFYPYKEKDAAGTVIDFPDEPSWQKYVASGGTLERDDWRRQNVDSFIERLYKEIKRARPKVRFGLSPFGIWRPGNPPQIKGFDQYAELYADARKWLQEGWVDYWTPQLYWKIEQAPQSYPVLLKWWAEQNAKGRNLWPGNYTSRVGGGGDNTWPAEEIVNQIRATRQQEGATGNVHFSMKAIMQNRGGLADALRSGPYARKALVPGSPWLDDAPPGTPKLSLKKGSGPREVGLSFRATGSEPVWLWLVQGRLGGNWVAHVLPGHLSNFDMKSLDAGFDTVAVSAVDRCGNLSEPAVVTIKAPR
jgi:uncharacterized lipoprotein YddW (UPF0748 family)